MSNTTLWLKGRVYSLEELKEGAGSSSTSFEESTLTFCKDWLNGKADFEIQTSGSTGVPKKISFTREQLEASAQLTAKALDLKNNFNALVCLDTKYIAGQMMLVRSFVTGMHIYAVEPSSNPFASLDSKIKIDFAAMVPYQLQALLDSPNEDRLHSIHTIIIGGAATSNGLIKRLQNYSCRCYATYGMTETISHVALRKLNGANSEEYFHPLDSVHLAIDHRGCLVIQAPHITEEQIATNDLVELKEDQSFKILGRWDNVINTGGVKISPEIAEEKIKAVFAQLALPNRLFLAAMPDEKLGSKVTLIIEGNPFPASMLDSISEELMKSLSRFELPRAIRFIEAFEETDTQKINRKKTTDLLFHVK